MKIDDAYNIWASIHDTNENKTRDLELAVSKSFLQKKYFPKILEIGCGTGKNTEWLSEICDSILCVDFSNEMLAIAKLKVIKSNVQFIDANILDNWNFLETNVDLITSNLVLEHIKDLDSIFCKAHKYLNKNGWFYICELHPFKQYIGSKARFEMGGEVVNLETYIHHISEYLDIAKKYSFKLLNLNEWFDKKENVELPRLVSFVFQKDE